MFVHSLFCSFTSFFFTCSMMEIRSSNVISNWKTKQTCCQRLFEVINIDVYVVFVSNTWFSLLTLIPFWTGDYFGNPQRLMFCLEDIGLTLRNLEELTLFNARLASFGGLSLSNLKSLEISGTDEFACESPDVVVSSLRAMPFLSKLTLSIRNNPGSSFKLNDFFEHPSLQSVHLISLCCFITFPIAIFLFTVGF